MADPISGALAAGGLAKLFGATTAIALGGAAFAGAAVGLGVAARDRRAVQALQKSVTQQQEFEVGQQQKQAEQIQQKEQQEQAVVQETVAQQQSALAQSSQNKLQRGRAGLRRAVVQRPSLFDILGRSQSRRSTLG